MSSASFATVAEYFRLGLQVGLLVPNQAVEWADAEIAAAEVAPEALIEVAWAKGVDYHAILTHPCSSLSGSGCG